MIDANEAERIGLATKTVQHEDLQSASRDLAERIAVNPSLALRFMKEGLRKGTFGDVQELGGWAIETIHRLMKTQDHKMGVANFLEKRQPVNPFTARPKNPYKANLRDTPGSHGPEQHGGLAHAA